MPTDHPNPDLSDEQWQEIDKAIYERDRVKAMHWLRASYSPARGLVDLIAVIQSRYLILREHNPDRFSPNDVAYWESDFVSEILRHYDGTFPHT